MFDELRCEIRGEINFGMVVEKVNELVQTVLLSKDGKTFLVNDCRRSIQNRKKLQSGRGSFVC